MLGLADLPTWDTLPFSLDLPSPPSRIRHTDVLRCLDHFSRQDLPGWRYWTIGHSVEQRPIVACTIGTGTTPILLWSQMHGDEPTHTAALLQLLYFLASSSDIPITSRILSSCQLTMIPMLNPDGAERWTRRNAQDIDINRDARHRQTPEGRALWSAVETIQPHFAFNLHNQSRHMAVQGSHCAAAVSLLVPSVDATGTYTEGMCAARQVASAFGRAVGEYCPGMVSRYSDEFIARAFGDSIQQTGCSTVLVEAGDWPGHTPDELVRLHYLGLVHTIATIADDCCRSVPASFYDALPENSNHSRWDFKVLDATITLDSGDSFRADVAIRFQSERLESALPGTGRIVDLGDLAVSSGLVEIQAEGGYCLPGGFLFDPAMTPSNLPDSNACQRLLSSGIVTLLGRVAWDDEHDWHMLQQICTRRLPLNFGFLGDRTKPATPLSPRLMSRLLNRNILAIIAEELPFDLRVDLREHAVPLVIGTALPQSAPQGPIALGEWRQWTSHVSRQLGLTDRGMVRRDAMADLLLFDSGHSAELDIQRLRQVFVGGTLAWERGSALLTDGAGQILHR